MSSLSHRLHLGVQQKQILTPGLVQMVTVLQLNRMELKDMIINEIAENPVLEEASEAGEELTPAEVAVAARARAAAEPADQAILEKSDQPNTVQAFEAARMTIFALKASADGTSRRRAAAATEETVKTETDPFDEIDFGSFFDDYLDPGFKSPASESIEKPSFETFLSSPVTLSDHLQSQLSVLILPERRARSCQQHCRQFGRERLSDHAARRDRGRRRTQPEGHAGRV